MGIKDKLISTAAEKFLETYVEDFGEIKKFEIDTDEKKIKFKINLLGEAETFILELLDYNLIRADKKTYIQVKDIDSSKEWIKVVFEKYFKNKKIEVPEKYSGWLDFI